MTTCLGCFIRNNIWSTIIRILLFIQNSTNKFLVHKHETGINMVQNRKSPQILIRPKACQNRDMIIQDELSWSTLSNIYESTSSMMLLNAIHTRVWVLTNHFNPMQHKFLRICYEHRYSSSTKLTDNKPYK